MNSNKKNIIRNFFHKDVSKDVRLNFYAWFMKDPAEAEIDETLLELWENSATASDKTTFKDLEKVQYRIWGKTQYKLSLRDILIRVAAVIMLPLISSLLTIGIYRQANNSSELDMIQCYAPLGEDRNILLPDGSAVALRSGTLLIYPKSFDGNARNVYLSGNGNFSVTKDIERPFTVKTNYLGITALGTVFTVEAYPYSDKTIATLEEGKIRVHTLQGDGLNEILFPDEQIVYNNTSNTYVKNIVDSHELANSLSSELVFRSESFENIIRALETHYDVIVNYEDGIYQNKSLTVRFSPNETLEQSFDILSKMVSGMQYTIKGNEVIIYKK